MKHLVRTIRPFAAVAFVFLLVFSACKDDDRDLDFLDQITVPQDLRLGVLLAQDNSGTVTFTPTAQGASTFVIDYGDGGGSSDELTPGQQDSHVYAEGTYTATLTAFNLEGESTTLEQEVVVSFRAPENLVVNVVQTSDAFTIEVSASADFAASFEVFFGEVADEEATPFGIGETVPYTYAEVGFYDVRVVALSGGAATAEETVTIEIRNPIVLPIDFESSTINYAFVDFGGAQSQVIDNPDPSGINTSTKVAEFFKEPGAEIFAGTILQLGDPIDFSEFQSFTVDVWSPLAGAVVKLKLENADDPTIATEIDAVTSVTNEWEQLGFDFSGADLTQEYSKVVIFFDFGNAGAGDTFYYDNIEQANVTTGPIVTLPVDFEDDTLDYGIFGFEGADSAREANPVPGGINTSANVVRSTKEVGAQFFAGTSVQLGEPIDFTESSSIRMKTYSPKAGIPVRMKLENSANPDEFVELDANTTVINTWETLVYDFTGASGTYDKIVVFFEFIVDLPGDGSTYYFDDIELDTPAGVELPVDFEDPELTYTVFGFEGADSAVEANAVPGGINTSATVVRTTKTAGAQFFAGTTVVLDSPVDFSATQMISINTYSPKAGIPVRLKLENSADSSEFVELDVNTNVIDTWETLTWDFSGSSPTGTYDRVVIFFEFVVDLPGDGSTYYFDDIQLAF